ncbi:MAG TPA: hypothetical protein VG407_14240 [Caulobacteraceae bacterium]|nr:hypothetical protein [Caulobacteraceae bacterium]
MTPADRVRRVIAACFPAGALGHFWWVGKHGLMYFGPAPSWAVWFWYFLCAVDFAVCALLLLRPRIGLIAGLATMAFTLWVNWTCFPTFELGFNYVLMILTAFGVAFAAVTPWLWQATPRRRCVGRRRRDGPVRSSGVRGL